MDILHKIFSLAGIISLSILGATMSYSNDFNKTNRLIVPGIYLEAWNVCYSAFLKIEDLSEEEKKLEHYEVEFSEDNENYIIEFIPKILSEEKAKIMNSMVIGRNTKYWISKNNLIIIKRVFYKS